MSETLSRPPLGALFRYFLRLGTTRFGGPIALVGYIKSEFERNHWATRQGLKVGLAFALLAPSPLAAQLAIYLGWQCAGVRCATVAGIISDFGVQLAPVVAWCDATTVDSAVD
jgi:chromate transporter